MQTTDLTQRPPRSPKTRLYGYSVLPRMLDKCRATLAGKNGEFHFACPLDQRILAFLGLDAEALKAEVAKGGGDAAVFEWIQANQKNKHSTADIEEWSEDQDKREPGAEDRPFFDQYLAACGPNRKDIKRWADLLDLDDYVTFGGKA